MSRAHYIEGARMARQLAAQLRSEAATAEPKHRHHILIEALRAKARAEGYLATAQGIPEDEDIAA